MHRETASEKRLCRTEQIDRYRQMHGSFPAGIRFRPGTPEIKRNLRRVWRLCRPLHDGPRHADLVYVLKSLAIAHRCRATAADRNHRAAGQIGRCNACDRIGVSRTAGNERNRRLAMNPRPCVSGMRHSRFVAHVNDPEPGACRLRQDVVEVIAYQGENLRDSKLLECVYKEGCASGHLL